MRYFIDRIRYRGAPKSPEEADRLALRQLAGRGADLSRPRHVIHFLYFDREQDANAAIEAIGDAWTTELEPPTESVGQWCVKADGNRTIGPETIAALRSWFERHAAEHNGEYDGWEAAAKP